MKLLLLIIKVNEIVYDLVVMLTIYRFDCDIKFLPCP